MSGGTVTRIRLAMLIPPGTKQLREEQGSRRMYAMRRANYDWLGRPFLHRVA